MKKVLVTVLLLLIIAAGAVFFISKYKESKDVEAVSRESVISEENEADTEAPMSEECQDQESNDQSDEAVENPNGNAEPAIGAEALPVQESTEIILEEDQEGQIR